MYIGNGRAATCHPPWRLQITKMMNQLKKQKKQRAVADGGKDSSTEGDIDD